MKTNINIFTKNFKVFLVILWVACFNSVSFAQNVKLQILKGPYLQNVTQNSIVVMWETNIETSGKVNYGQDKNYGLTATAEGNKKIHEIKLTNLKVETLYHYQIITGDITAEDNTFKTAPNFDTPFKFSVWGDNRTFFFEHAKVIRRMRKYNPDIAINVGDVVTNGEVYEQWGLEYFTPAKELFKSVASFIAIGNHEKNSHWFYDFVSQPNNEAWFYFIYGNAMFIILDSNQSYMPGSQQLLWFRKTLKSDDYKKTVWHFVVMHHPLYSEGWDSPGYAGEQMAQLTLKPLFEKYKIDIFFAGHTHDYERGFLNNVYYIISGGGGAGLDSFQQDFPFVTVYKAEHQFCLVDINKNKLSFKSINVDEQVIDSFEIAK